MARAACPTWAATRTSEPQRIPDCRHERPRGPRGSRGLSVFRERGTQAGGPVYFDGVRGNLPVLGLAVVLFVAVRAWASGSAASSAVQEVGYDYYVEACASCHGMDGRGGGPVASSLAIKPPDLTTMAARRNGKYPYDELAAYIDGRKAVAAHGSREMPVWGEQIAEEYPNDPQQDRIIHGKVLMLLVYLESIQR